jgi:hypothetical protein
MQKEIDIVRPCLVFLQKNDNFGRFYPINEQAIAIARSMRRITLGTEELFVLGSAFEVEVLPSCGRAENNMLLGAKKNECVSDNFDNMPELERFPF